MNGGRALVETLLRYGIDTAFALPGESYLEVLEALRQAQNQIRLVINRHESGVSFAATAYGRLVNKPGVAFVSRGPGATNASIGIHTARQDSTPLVVFIGQVPTEELGWEAFQEIDYHQMFGPMTKGVFQALLPSEVAPLTARALELAVEGRPGPVVVVLPENVTEAEVANVDIPEPQPRAPHTPDAEAIAQAAKLIDEADHPVVLAGEMINFELAHEALRAFVEKSGAGLVAAFRRQGILPTSHPAYLGHFGLALMPYQSDFWKEVDLVVAAGTRLDGATTMDFKLVRDDQTLIHIFPDRAVLESRGADLAIDSDSLPALEALTAALGAPSDERLAWRDEHHDIYTRWALPDGARTIGPVDMTEVMRVLAERLPQDATVVNDAGNFATWLQRYLPFSDWRGQLGPAVGAMGFGVPGALGAQLARPDKTVVAVAGDGGFLMTGQELVTAVDQNLPIKVLVCDNGAYGTIAMHQFRRHGAEHTYGIKLKSPDFAAAARAWGAEAWTVAETAAFAPALDAALTHRGPALIHIKTDLRDLAATGLKME